jgi:hypothetical protein
MRNRFNFPLERPPREGSLKGFLLLALTLAVLVFCFTLMAR